MRTKQRGWIRGCGVLVATAVAVACASNSVPLETEPEPTGASGASGASGAVTTDSDFSCEFRQEPDWGPYGSCSYSGSFEGDYEQQCVEGGWRGWSSDAEGEECGGCRCTVSCDERDCPLPETGNVTPQCQNDECVLPCDQGELCPDGMKCTEVRDEPGAYCAWVFNEDNSLGCAYDRDRDVCNQYSTQAECEARLDGDPRQPLLACLWATVSTFNTGDDACEPLQVDHKCIATRLPSLDYIQDSQRCGDSFVYWKDLGAGTATLTELERCGYEPLDTNRCEFGDPSLPILCDCACSGSQSSGQNPGTGIPGATPTHELCELRPERSVGPYGYCSNPGGPASPSIFPFMQCPEPGMRGFGLDEPESCDACQCILACTEDDDCPATESGNVEPVCDGGECELPCDSGETCPDGMRCHDRRDEGRFCVWAEDPETSESCRISLDENACAQATTKESCEAAFLVDPHQPLVACLWATESTYSTASDSCEALVVEERCIPATLSEHTNLEPAAHRCGDVSVFWRDLGAGTARLLQIEACGYEPSGNDVRGYQRCELGDPSIPYLCSCGCE